MYLSKAYLNTLSRFVLRDISDHREMHRTVSSAFPDVIGGLSARQKYKILYRIEFQLKKNRIYLLLQSKEKPKWQNIEQKYPDYLLEKPKVKDISEFINDLKKDMICRFKLRANPTKKISGNQKKSEDKEKKYPPLGKRGTRIPLKREEQQIQWLVRKGEVGGFKPKLVRVAKEQPVHDLIVLPDRTFLISPSKGKNSRPEITLYSVVFEGHLTINDREKFIETLQNGIGPGKAYGFGLLSVAPLRT